MSTLCLLFHGNPVAFLRECDIIYLKNESTYSNKENTMAGKKGHSGGARKGAGRKPNEIHRSAFGV